MESNAVQSKVFDLPRDITTLGCGISGLVNGGGRDGSVIIVDVLRVDVEDELDASRFYLADDTWRFPVIDLRRCQPIARYWATIPKCDNYLTQVGIDKMTRVSLDVKTAEHRLLMVVHHTGVYNNSRCEVNVSAMVYYTR